MDMRLYRPGLWDRGTLDETRSAQQMFAVESPFGSSTQREQVRGMRGGRVFLTWHDSRRSMSLADRTGLERRVFVPDRSGGLRHVVGVLRRFVFS